MCEGAKDSIANPRCMMSMRFAPKALICERGQRYQRALVARTGPRTHLDNDPVVALLEGRALRLANVQVLRRVALAVLDQHCAHLCHGEGERAGAR